MKTHRPSTAWLVSFFLLRPGGVSAQGASGAGELPISGTSWQLVKFQGGDDKVLTPDDGAKYTIAFDSNASVTARIDCNRGRGTWASSGPNQVQFGPLALTRAMCPPGSLHDEIVKDWSLVRSYVITDGHLFLSLMADGGIYEFEPARGATAAEAYKAPVTSTGPITYECTPKSPGRYSIRATFYKTQPEMVLVERGGAVRPAFQVTAASGARYEGDGVLFWEARGEASVVWLDVKLTCKRS